MFECRNGTHTLIDEPRRKSSMRKKPTQTRLWRYPTHVAFSFPNILSFYLTYCRPVHPTSKGKWILCRLHRLHYNCIPTNLTWMTCLMFLRVKHLLPVVVKQMASPLGIVLYTLLLCIMYQGIIHPYHGFRRGALVTVWVPRTWVSGLDELSEGIEIDYVDTAQLMLRMRETGTSSNWLII